MQHYTTGTASQTYGNDQLINAGQTLVDDRKAYFWCSQKVTREKTVL